MNWIRVYDVCFLWFVCTMKLLSIKQFCWPNKLSSNRVISSAPRQSALLETFSRKTQFKACKHISYKTYIYWHSKKFYRSPLHKLSAFLRYICAERLHEYPATLNHIRQKLHIPKNLLRRHAFPGILSLSLSATYTKISILSVCIARLPRFACYAREPNEPISIEISKRKQHQQQQK